MHIPTLIFGLGMLNLMLAIVVYLYRHTSRQDRHELRIWQYAKLVSGLGYLLGWVRPQLPADWAAWAHIGNVMQVVGISMELVVFAIFFGAEHYTQWIKKIMTLVIFAFIALIVIPESRHPMIVYGTGAAGALYLAISCLNFAYVRQHRQLLLLLAVTNMILSLVLLFKAAVGLSGYQMVPFHANMINIVLYSCALCVASINGYAFLLLTQTQIDKKLHTALEALESRHKAERELFRMAAHEFRTPAAMVKASLDSLALIDQNLPDDVTRRHLNIRKAAQRMTDLASTLITRDRIRDEGLALYKHPVNIHAMVRLVVEKYPGETPLEVILEDHAPEVEIDAELMQIAVMNLIDNALTHSPPSVPITIAVKIDAQTCFIDVRDLGEGVPDSLKCQLFDQWYSTSGSLAKGLGLTIVKSILLAHQGNVTVLDNQPQGSVFSLHLPLHPSQGNQTNGSHV